MGASSPEGGGRVRGGGKAASVIVAVVAVPRPPLKDLGVGRSDDEIILAPPPRGGLDLSTGTMGTTGTVAGIRGYDGEGEVSEGVVSLRFFSWSQVLGLLLTGLWL